jgi:predicted neutral ceramidase superfamily lipid hydrolase
MHPWQDAQEQSNKPYESFLSFVAFTITIRLLPLFESFASHIVLQVMIGLVLVGVVIKFFINNRKLPYLLRKICERLNISIILLYIAYITLYLFVTLVIL